MKNRRILAVLLIGILLLAFPVQASGAETRYINCRNTTQRVYGFAQIKNAGFRVQDSFACGSQIYRFASRGNERVGLMQVCDYKNGKQKAIKMIYGGHCSAVTPVIRNNRIDVYLETNFTPSAVYVNSVVNDKATLLHTLKFPDKEYGYYMKHAVDPGGKYIYGIAYKKKSRLSSAGGNRMIISVWDLRKLTKVKGSTPSYTPKLISSFETGFIPYTQGMCVYGNKIYIMSSDYTAPRSKVFAVSLREKRITDVYCNFPDNIKKREMQGVFIKGGWLFIDSGWGLFRQKL